MRKSNTDAVPRGGRPRGPGAIRQPGNSFAGLWFSYDPETGKHVQHSKAGFASHDEAQGHLTTVLASVRAATFTRDSGARGAARFRPLAAHQVHGRPRGQHHRLSRVGRQASEQAHRRRPGFLADARGRRQDGRSDDVGRPLAAIPSGSGRNAQARRGVGCDSEADPGQPNCRFQAFVATWNQHLCLAPVDASKGSHSGSLTIRVQCRATP
jgi:hypothetical protein